MPGHEDLSLNSALVFRRLSLRELAVLVDNLAVEFSTRLCPGVSALACAARYARERADAFEHHRAIHGDDCTAPPP